ASVSTISGKRRGKALPGRPPSFTCAPFLRAMMRKPSCLISCRHWLPDGSLSGFVGREGAMKPVGRVRCNMGQQIELGNGDCNFTRRGPGSLGVWALLICLLTYSFTCLYLHFLRNGDFQCQRGPPFRSRCGR